MKLYHFGLSLMFAMPVLAETPSQPSLLETTGTVYVHARFLITPCQPNVTMTRAVNHVNEPVYQFTVSYAHCATRTYNQPWTPFTLKFAGQQYVFSKPQANKSMTFLLPAENSARRLEMIYD
ncbi:hypothetical protein [Providencia alcalifaciens]|uniref:hypothetical protein n=1 Tax=Providencia alcalifaciens TaxID=126385 RepID=UPI001CC4C6DD|nr:hypothetical protein [Providencia alcalifaciens]CAG9411502.1 hypothetical protein NVI2019_GHJFPKLH_00748 [Providencia alcalifaciens]